MSHYAVGIMKLVVLKWNLAFTCSLSSVQLKYYSIEVSQSEEQSKQSFRELDRGKANKLKFRLYW